MPLVRDQEAQVRTNPPPWTPKVSAQIIQMFAEEKAGHPRPLFVECLPEGMPSWMLITHNALEFLFTPGRVTVLGESDGNRLRRIYTDGRPHPYDPDPTFHGHSIGHWEGVTLVVDTVGILPQSYLAISEAVGAPNNGDMRVIERIHLQGTDFLHDDLEIIAPRIPTTPWKTTRIFSANANGNSNSSKVIACRRASSTASTRTAMRLSSRSRITRAATSWPRNEKSN